MDDTTPSAPLSATTSSAFPNGNDRIQRQKPPARSRRKPPSKADQPASTGNGETSQGTIQHRRSIKQRREWSAPARGNENASHGWHVSAEVPSHAETAASASRPSEQSRIFTRLPSSLSRTSATSKHVTSVQGEPAAPVNVDAPNPESSVASGSRSARPGKLHTRPRPSASSSAMSEHVVSAQEELDGKTPTAPRQGSRTSRRRGKFNSSLTESAEAVRAQQEASAGLSAMPEHVVSEQGELDGKKPAAPRQGSRISRRGGKFNSSLTESAAAALAKQEAPARSSAMSEHVVSAQGELDGKKPAAPQQGPRVRRRGGKFNSSLTMSATAAFEKQEAKPSQKHRNAAPKADDLTSRLIHDFSTAPYPDCLICFAAIHPAQPTWSCSPSIPISALTDDEGDGSRPRANTAQCCWTTFHLKCIRAWASKSVKDMMAAWRARGVEKKGEWRCPGCQAKREIVPSGYWCFCGSTPEPKLSRLATPHSCGNLCSRPRACGHPCPLACHPGPCPPCQVTLQLSCHCGKQMLSFRCSHLAPEKTNNKIASELSCGQKCGHKLGCGNHDCEEICHPGPCPPCKVRHKARCYCGKEERELGCGEGEEKDVAVMEEGQEKRWTGQFECGEVCGRPFDCGIHTCSKPCHPPSFTPEPCPRSPSLVTHCPCGKHVLKPSSSPFFPPGTLLMRTSCTDPIPTCESNCMKPLEGCSHACSARCHTGPCPPCRIMVVRPCRCGATTRDVPCFEDQARGRGDTGVEEILCDRPCTALRACGKHRCNRLCCPLASLASAAKGKGKKKAEMESAIVDESGWHECDLVCGKLLSCGNHHCEQRDHRGACPPCLRSSFDEMICKCGRTILEPPIPCGTRISCHYPCARPPPPCGHPKTQHLCHEDPIPCPPCVFLTSKRCACGKKMVDNVKCSQEKVSCGTPCGKLLVCGFHRCERLCHNDACGPCTAVCGKPRKLCLPAHHPCPLPCHAPAACSEAEPCRSIVTLTCPCGRIRQQVPCGRCTTNPTGREHSQQLKCSNECLVAKRNARLAEALGINPDRGTMHPVTYSDELLAFAKANAKFCTMVEKSLADFLSSDKKSQILAPMPEVRRKFVHDLAVVYRIDTQMVDQEPNRSVQLFRRIDSRLPAPLLSAAATVPHSSSSSPAFNLGKLADLRSSTVHQLPRTAAPPARSVIPPPTSGLGGWSAAVVRPPSSASSSVWASRPVGSEPATRPSSAVSLPHPPHQAVTIAAHADEHVPDSWEDDA